MTPDHSENAGQRFRGPSPKARSTDPAAPAAGGGEGAGKDVGASPAAGAGGARLDEFRARIDALDRRLVELLNERAALVVEIGRLKGASGAPTYVPHREQDVLKRALAANKGPLSNRTIEGVFREIMSGSFALEQPPKIGYLGPPGSFSHLAATQQFGSSVGFHDVHEIGAVFSEVVRGHIDYGLVPIENSTGGGIVETLDAFRDSRGEVTIYAEVLVAVSHNLMSCGAADGVRKIYSKPEVFGQCRRWLSAQYPEAEQAAVASSSRGAAMAREAWEKDPGCGAAAIASTLAASLYGLDILFADIEDNPNNITRFFVISRHAARPSGDDKTSMMFITADKPGALVSVLSEFDRAGINLTHIDKRPSGRENWRYTFFIDAQGHRESPQMQAAVKEAAGHCQELTVLGSYPRAARIL